MSGITFSRWSQITQRSLSCFGFFWFLLKCYTKLGLPRAAFTAVAGFGTWLTAVFGAAGSWHHLLGLVTTMPSDGQATVLCYWRRELGLFLLFNSFYRSLKWDRQDARANSQAVQTNYRLSRLSIVVQFYTTAKTTAGLGESGASHDGGLHHRPPS